MNGEELRCSLCGKPLGYTLMDGSMPKEVFCRSCFAKGIWTAAVTGTREEKE